MTTDKAKTGTSKMPAGEPTAKAGKDVSDKAVTFVQKKGTKTTAKQDSAIQLASAKVVEDKAVMPAAGFNRVTGGGCADGSCGGEPSWGIKSHGLGFAGGFGHGGHGGVSAADYGPMGHGLGTYLGNNGIMPVPAMGPPGAVAAIGAIGPGSPYGPTISNQRTAIKFVSPEKARIGWLVGNSYVESGLVAPASYNFMQGNVYRLKLAGVPTQAGRVYYPTLEVAPATLKTVTYLSHNSVPVSFTNDDFERVNAGNLVVKVIYLPDPAFQDAAALGGAEEVVSTQLEPGADPIVEATRRGTILAVIRLGNINLENPNSPAMDAVGAPMGVPPGMMAPPAPPMGGTTAAPKMLPTQPVGALPSIPQVR
jgi:hypothetical protein